VGQTVDVDFIVARLPKHASELSSPELRVKKTTEDYLPGEGAEGQKQLKTTGQGPWAERRGAAG
jgi:hypothetical protein